MKLALPSLTVIDRSVPYAYENVEIPIFEEDEPRMRDAARLDLIEMRQAYAAGPSRDQDRLPDRIIQVDVGTRIVAAPGDPTPFVRRDVGAVDCGALSGIAAIYCAVMARR